MSNGESPSRKGQGLRAPSDTSPPRADSETTGMQEVAGAPMPQPLGVNFGDDVFDEDMFATVDMVAPAAATADESSESSYDGASSHGASSDEEPSYGSFSHGTPSYEPSSPDEEPSYGQYSHGQPSYEPSSPDGPAAYEQPGATESIIVADDAYDTPPQEIFMEAGDPETEAVAPKAAKPVSVGDATLPDGRVPGAVEVGEDNSQKTVSIHLEKPDTDEFSVPDFAEIEDTPKPEVHHQPAVAIPVSTATAPMPAVALPATPVSGMAAAAAPVRKRSPRFKRAHTMALSESDIEEVQSSTRRARAKQSKVPPLPGEQSAAVPAPTVKSVIRAVAVEETTPPAPVPVSAPVPAASAPVPVPSPSPTAETPPSSVVPSVSFAVTPAAQVTPPSTIALTPPIPDDSKIAAGPKAPSKKKRADTGEPPPPPPAVPAKAKGPSPSPPLPGTPSRRIKPWYEEIFDEDYLRTLPFLTPQATQFEANFVMESLGVDAGSQILDIGCGYGRHAMELAARGYHVVGLDSSLPLLLRGSDEAQRRGLTINFVHGDMREMTFESQFDGAYCLFSSFGYFDDETNKRTAQHIAKALKPGARLVIDVLNRDYLVADLPSRIWWEGDGCVVLEEVEFNYFSSRIQSKRSVVFDDGRQLEQEISVRSFSLHELGKFLHAVGFRVLEISGSMSTRGRFFGAHSRDIVVVAERRA